MDRLREALYNRASCSSDDHPKRAYASRRNRIIHVFSALKRLLNEKGHRYYYVFPVLHPPIKMFIRIVAPMDFDML